MVSKFWCNSFLVMTAFVFFLCGCKSALLGEAAVVIPEKMEVRSSTARASRPIGNLKRGDQVKIVERTTEGDVNYVRIQGPEGLDGWASATNLATQANLEKAQELAASIAGIPVQAECRTGASIKVRLTPDRSSDENVLVILPAGTGFEIYDRETRPKAVEPKALEKEPSVAAKPGAKSSESASSGANYEVWYKAKPKDHPLIPAGYIYGGSVELDVPQEIAYFMHPDRKIVGWQRLGSVKDDRGQDNHHYVIFQKAYNQADEKSDFDYFQIVGFDAKNKSVSYYNVMRKEIRGTFPVTVKIEDKRAAFQFKSLDSGNAESSTEFSILTDDKGRVRVPPDQQTAAKK
jgi:Bacterial SH3 domain